MPGKRHISWIIISAVFLTCIGSIADVSARNRKELMFVQGSELRLSWGVKQVDALTFGPLLFKDYFFTTGSIASSIAASQYYAGDAYISGAVGLTYSYRFRKWFELSAVMTYSGYYRNYYDKYTDRLAFKGDKNQISVMPYVRFVWVHTNLVRLYSGLGLGVSFLMDSWDNSTSLSVIPAFAVTPVGITVGTYVYGFAEVTVGATGLFSVGIGYKF